MVTLLMSCATFSALIFSSIGQSNEYLDLFVEATTLELSIVE